MNAPVDGFERRGRGKDAGDKKEGKELSRVRDYHGKVTGFLRVFVFLVGGEVFRDNH